jgi:hypothetical protein
MFRASFKYVSYEVNGLTISNDAVYVSLGGHWAMFVCIVFHYSLYCLVGFQFVLIRVKCISAGFLVSLSYTYSRGYYLAVFYNLIIGASEASHRCACDRPIPMGTA